MRFFTTKQGVALLAVLVVAVVAAIGAYAYFATTGAGNGTANAGQAAASEITLYASFADGALVPGGHVDVTFTADNLNATTNERVNTIKFGSVTSSDTGCKAVIDANPSQFSMADVTSNTTVTKGASAQALTGTGSLVWDDSLTQDQTACSGKPLTLNVTSN